MAVARQAGGLALLFCLLIRIPCVQARPREIALSFDDAPTPGSQIFSGPERTRRLITGLRKAGAPPAVFFCTARYLKHPHGPERMRLYARAGHLLANHSYSHLDLDTVPAARFIRDVERADKVLAGMKGFRRWFRYPRLHQGNTRQKRATVRRALQRMGYKVGYVTVDTYDQALNTLVRRAIRSRRKVDLHGLGRRYVSMLVDGAELYDAAAKKVLGRSPRHVLLLHENDLAALFIEDLIRGLRKAGWTIVSPRRAYADPLAALEPAHLFHNQGRVMAVARARGYRGPTRHRSEDHAYLKKMLAPFIHRRGGSR